MPSYFKRYDTINKVMNEQVNISNHVMVEEGLWEQSPFQSPFITEKEMLPGTTKKFDKARRFDIIFSKVSLTRRNGSAAIIGFRGDRSEPPDRRAP
jgi:hypothetical protein